MLKNSLFTLSLLLPLTAISATAHAGATISDKRYWPSEARRAQGRTVSSQSDLNSAFAYDRATSSLQPPANANDAASAWYYQGGPKSH
jgi:hypothetical protein